MSWRQYAFPAAILGIAAIAGIVVLIANSGGDDGGKSAANGCADVRRRSAQGTSASRSRRSRLDPSKTYRATVETSCGTFVIKLDAKQAPKTGGSFVTLARKGFYDGLGFHRIAPGFVIQGGDPAGNGTGGPGYKIRERPPKDVVYSEGTVAMAKGGNEPAGTSGSQFFVVTGGRRRTCRPTTRCSGRSQGPRRRRTGSRTSRSTSDGPPSRPVVIKKITIAGERSSQ